ncbi:MAG: hypothetical protein ACI4VP_06430 [Clostridia bacterium]
MRNKTLKNVLIILILFVSVAAVIIPQELNNLDELWNYNFARNIADGLLPYKDFNMVQMPLLPIICGTILKLTVNELIVMRILAVLLITAILFLTYKIFETLKIHQYIINILIIGIYLLFYEHFCIDYNFCVLLIILITIYCELKSLSKGKEILDISKNDFWLGILVGTSIAFKQTTGIFVSVIFLFYKLLLCSKKEDFKKTFKIIAIRLLGVLIPIVLLAIYLSVDNIWKDFLDYTIYSLKTFTNKISYLNLVKGNYGIDIAILSILVPLTIAILYFVSICKKIKTDEQKNIFILFCYSVAAFIVVYPISDSIHFLIGSFPSLISIGYILWIVARRIIEKNKYNKVIYGIKCFINIFTVISILVLVLYSVAILIQYISTCKQYNELEHFKYIPASSEKIKKIDDFILEQNKEGKEVYILDATAAIYMIPIDKYNKDYDMFLKGNLGAKGEDGQIEKLESETNTVILIMNKNYRRNWQNPEKVRKYIINNWVKVGQIENFDIYEKDK